MAVMDNVKLTLQFQERLNKKLQELYKDFPRLHWRVQQGLAFILSIIEEEIELKRILELSRWEDDGGSFEIT